MFSGVDLKGIVLYGNGKHFCAGGDPNSLKDSTFIKTMTEYYQFGMLLWQLRSLNVPIVSVVHGKIQGGGVALMLQGDYIISL